MLAETDTRDNPAVGDSSRTKRPRIVVIGAGFAGIAAVRALERDAAVLVYRAKGTQRVAVDFQIGDRSPLHCSSIGKVLLAFRDMRATEAVIAAGLTKVAPNTITDPDELRRSLARIRAEGYAFDDLEFAPDMRCVAIPVFENGGEVPGGIAISGPASRFDLGKLSALRDVAQHHAAKLSRELGGVL